MDSTRDLYYVAVNGTSSIIRFHLCAYGKKPFLLKTMFKKKRKHIYIYGVYNLNRSYVHTLVEKTEIYRDISVGKLSVSWLILFSRFRQNSWFGLGLLYLRASGVIRTQIA